MKIFRLIRFPHIIFSLILLAAGGCSTQKNTSVSRAFHNVTAKYNYFFNANESYNNAIQRAEASYDYNYTFPLPVMLLGDKQVVSMVGGDMDRAITKCTDMISRHSITVKPERKRGVQTPKERQFYNQNEFVRWVRNGWLLVGKARVWKGAYDEARMTLEYNLTQFPDTHTWFESQLWLARMDIIDKDFVAAEDRLRGMTANRKYPKTKYFKHLLESSWAFFYQEQENVPQTIKYLERALPNAPNKEHRVRYCYILGQLYQQQHKFVESNKYFKRVIGSNPSYEKSFNARVSIASNYQGGGSGQEMIRTLTKMSRDEKNIEFLDQIYYALGNIEQTRGNTDKAIEYYLLSAQKSVKNNHQKGLSYLILADYFFAKPEYTKSQAYYDSSYNALDSDFPGYLELEVKTKNLNKLVTNLNIIANEDSLQRIAAMPPTERDAIIAQQIKAIRDVEDLLKQEEQEGRDRFSQFQQMQRVKAPAAQEGSWYFYNQSSLSFGLSEFQMRWGRRKLEDSWRRVNKREVMDQPAAVAQANTDSTGIPAKVIDNKSREFYMQDLPMNDSLLSLSHQRIQEALFRVGEVYQNELKDFPEAIKAYEQLPARYPKSSYTLMAYYNLYQIARFNQQEKQMEQYKQALISNFPSSTYALMLGNPNYIENLQKQILEQEEYYVLTYEQFKQGDCINASRRASDGLARYKDSDLSPKFQFIIAQCVGQSGDIRSYRIELGKVVELYPQTDVAKSASSILSLLDQRELQLASAQDGIAEVTGKPGDQAKPAAIYVKPEGEHLFIAIVPKKSPLNQLRFNLISFNVDYYINLNLNVSSKELTEFVELIIVEPFKEQKDVMEYYAKASAEQGLMGGLAETDYSFVVISRANLDILLKDKSVAGYLNFFRENYLK